jgi:predicted nucleic acid-binding protein
MEKASVTAGVLRWTRSIGRREENGGGDIDEHNVEDAAEGDGIAEEPAAADVSRSARTTKTAESKSQRPTDLAFDLAENARDAYVATQQRFIIEPAKDKAQQIHAAALDFRDGVVTDGENVGVGTGKMAVAFQQRSPSLGMEGYVQAGRGVWGLLTKAVIAREVLSQGAAAVQSRLAALRRSGEIGLDTNALIDAVNGGPALAAIGRRMPVVSPTVAAEFLRGSAAQRSTLGVAEARSANTQTLRAFLRRFGGHVGAYSTEAGREAAKQAGAKFSKSNLKNRSHGDPGVIHSTILDGIRLLTRDAKLLKNFPQITETF